jgi:hypothetical protein
MYTLLTRTSFQYRRHTVVGDDGELDPVLCSSFVYGFTLQRKIWCKFYIDRLTPVPWNEDAMEKLVLPRQQKQILRALVSSHSYPIKASEEFELKGNCLVVLHS